ncbi:MAG: hypothetical protein BroJett040_17190 [Oligoflexia bacterium]|nr:MAG: hypothetical protein BroJett040_17190 [Oligoflexia bacterium]
MKAVIVVRLLILVVPAQAPDLFVQALQVPVILLVARVTRHHLRHIMERESLALIKTRAGKSTGVGTAVVESVSQGMETVLRFAQLNLKFVMWILKIGMAVVGLSMFVVVIVGKLKIGLDRFATVETIATAK